LYSFDCVSLPLLTPHFFEFIVCNPNRHALCEYFKYCRLVQRIKTRHSAVSRNRRYDSKIKTNGSTEATTTTISTCLQCEATNFPNTNDVTVAPLFLLCDTCGVCLCQSCFYHYPNDGPSIIKDEVDGNTESKMGALPTSTVGTITTNKYNVQSTCTMICSRCRLFETTTTSMVPLRR
jgi:hypothetical protein